MNWINGKQYPDGNVRVVSSGGKTKVWINGKLSKPIDETLSKKNTKRKSYKVYLRYFRKLVNNLINNL